MNGQDAGGTKAGGREGGIHDDVQILKVPQSMCGATSQADLVLEQHTQSADAATSKRDDAVPTEGGGEASTEFSTIRPRRANRNRARGGPGS